MDKYWILLVDDDPAVCRSLGKVLEVLGGFADRTEQDGSRTLAVARDFQPDLILLDVTALDCDGGAIAAEIEADPELRELPVAFITGLVSTEDLPNSGAPGAPRVIPKDTEPAGLVDIVRDLLAGRSLTPTPSPTDRGRQALARVLVGLGPVAKGSLSDREVAALVDRLWPDFKAAVAEARAETERASAQER